MVSSYITQSTAPLIKNLFVIAGEDQSPKASELHSVHWLKPEMTKHFCKALKTFKGGHILGIFHLTLIGAPSERQRGIGVARPPSQS